jgi:hypothetical protein
MALSISKDSLTEIDRYDPFHKFMDSRCQDIWLQLNEIGLTSLPDYLYPGPSRERFPAVLQYFTENSRVKTINIGDLSKEDASYLAGIGISQAHLVRNLRETLTRHFDPLRFQLDAVQNKSVRGFCPFGGGPVVSRQSLLANINVICYRFETKEVFYVATAGIGSGFGKSALYFPKHELVVTAGDPWGFQEDDLMELKARMVCGAKACCEYLSDTEGKSRKSAVCLGFYHFAHHLWNELSGLHRLYKKGLLRRVDRFLVLREPLGPIEQIFPEIPEDRIQRKDDTSDLFYEILENGYFAVRVGDDYLASDLASRVAKVSSANCLPTTLDTVKDAKSRYHPLLWVGIRVGNRAWADQVDGLSNMIASLQKEYPTLGVVFDGFSLPADISAESSEQRGYAGILAQENEIVNRIVENLRQRQVAVGIFNIIGLSIHDANVWAHAIDVYVSPYGSLQHKVGWLANKPGLVHTNETLLQSPAKYVWAAVENGIPPRYVRGASVTDIKSEPKERTAYNEIGDASESGAGIQAANKRVRKNPEFNNYSITWESLHQDLFDLIRSSKTKNGMARLLLANRVKRKLRLTVRSITNVLCWR